jgi:Lysozyme like domain
MANATSTGSLSYAQLKGVWLGASKGTRYHSNAWASLMAAIAEAESSGDPLATNPTDNNGTQTSWGLWQISDGNHSEPAPNWADPNENAKLAIQKLDGQGLSAWGTYTSGAYKWFLSDKTAADLTAAGPDAVTQAQATAEAKAGAACAWGIGSLVPNPSFFGFHPLGSFQGGICILSKSQARALVGVGIATAGAIVIGLGVAWVVSVGVPEAATLALIKTLTAKAPPPPGPGRASAPAQAGVDLAA